MSYEDKSYAELKAIAENRGLAFTGKHAVGRLVPSTTRWHLLHAAGA